MAGNGGPVAESERCPPSLPSKEGPVLSMMSKRLRALKKKYNKILQIEESKAQGKVINKEQEEVLKQKIAVAALIDEYEKLRQPLLVAVKEELAEREKELMAATLRRDEGGEEESMAGEEKDAEVSEGSQQKLLAEVRKESDTQNAAVCSTENTGTNADNLEKEPLVLEAEHTDDTSSGSRVVNGNIADLLTFLYFAQLFDVRSHGEASSSVLWTKTHERSSCLSYDCVTEDETSPLLESDLDDLSLFGSLLTSRPPNATLSHRDALQHCIKHAKLWQQNSDDLIREDLDLTYSRLRERLNRILSSEYFTMIPELQTVTQQTAVAAASATAQFASQLLIQKTGDTPALDEAIVYFSPQESTSQQPPYHIGEEHYPSQPVAATGSFDASGVHFGTNTSELSKDEKVDSRASPGDGMQSLPNGVQQEHRAAEALQPDGSPEHEHEQQQQAHAPNVSVGPRGHQGPKGGGRGNNYGTGGRGRGYVNGRGGRNGGSRGGYGNGWSGQYYDQGGYYPRSYNGRGGGRGVRGGNSTFHGYTNGQAARATNNAPA